MELIKRNEVFGISGTTEHYIVEGTVNRDHDGNINVNFRLSNLDETGIGNGYYNKYIENNYSDFGVSGSDENYAKLIEYAKEVVAFVNDNLDSIN